MTLLAAAVLLGGLVAIAVAQTLSGEPGGQRQDTGDTGREMALAAGCDMSGNEVPMNVGEIDYVAGFGYPSVEEAVIGFSGYLRQNGFSVSQDDLREAAAAATTGTIPIEVRLDGASLHIMDTPDGYLVGEVVLCA